MNKKAAGSKTKLQAPLIDAALYYQKIGFSVIPIRQNKKPYCGWTKYQNEPASPAQIREWWGKWPKANIGLVTGSVSGVDVVDVDTEPGWTALNEFLPESLQTPISRTPGGGWHVYFSYKKGLSNGVRVIEGCDLRTSGGYVIAPPSQNGNGKSYSWLEGLKITDVKPSAMPEMLFDVLQQGSGPPDGHASSREHIKKVKSSRTGDNISGYNKPITGYNKYNISFEKGGRDDSLFRLANHLVKGGMPRATIQEYLTFFASHCNPPYPEKDISAKIESAFKRLKKRSGSLTQEIRELIGITSGNITTTFVSQSITSITSKEDRKKVNAIMWRMAKEGILESTGRVAGEYRIVENTCEPENWQNACTDTVDLWLPFELGEIVEVMPGDIVLIAGAQNAGKSALMMNIAKENRHSYNVHYFSSELRPGSFNRRMSKFPDVTPDQLNINFYQRSSNFGDVIRTGEGNLNIIDYIELHDQFYLISEILSTIHDKLDGALCVAAIQKDPKALYGRGGSFTQEKPVLSISLDQSVATISKCKEWREGHENPNGKQYNFKIVDGCRLKRAMGWHKPQIE